MKTFKDYLEMAEAYTHGNPLNEPFDDLSFQQKNEAMQLIKGTIMRMITSGSSAEETRNKVLELCKKYGITQNEEKEIYDRIMRHIELVEKKLNKK